MRGFMLAAIVVAVVVMVRTAFENEYDPCDDPNRAALEVMDEVEKAESDAAAERSMQLLGSYLTNHCKMEPQEWDMIAMFVQTGLNREICEDTRKAIMQSTNTEGYRCVQLPEDWRKHSVDQVVGRALTLGPRGD